MTETDWAVPNVCANKLTRSSSTIQPISRSAGEDGNCHVGERLTEAPLILVEFTLMTEENVQRAHGLVVPPQREGVDGTVAGARDGPTHRRPAVRQLVLVGPDLFVVLDGLDAGSESVLQLVQLEHIGGVRGGAEQRQTFARHVDELLASDLDVTAATLRLVLDAAGKAEVNYLRSLTSATTDDGRTRHPGHWADQEGLLANSYESEVL